MRKRFDIYEPVTEVHLNFENDRTIVIEPEPRVIHLSQLTKKRKHTIMITTIINKRDLSICQPLKEKNSLKSIRIKLALL